jgi:hypothetical protein
MDARTFSTVTLEAEHVPDYVHPPLNNPGEGAQELPGVVNLYAVFDGGRVLLDTIKAPVVFEAIDRAQNEQAQQQDGADASEAGGQTSSSTAQQPAAQYGRTFPQSDQQTT